MVTASFLLVLTLAAAAPPAAAELPRECRAKIDARLPGWRPKLPSADVAAWAADKKFDPAFLQVDLDNDGVRDSAVLIVTGSGEPQVHIAVCMARKTGPELHLISDPYCRDGIVITRKGTRAHNYETDKEVTYRTNGIHAFCFEQAGGTYIYRGGRFILIVDSD